MTQLDIARGLNDFVEELNYFARTWKLRLQYKVKCWQNRLWGKTYYTTFADILRTGTIGSICPNMTKDDFLQMFGATNGDSDLQIVGMIELYFNTLTPGLNAYKVRFS
ncbi:MAG: hypothetical protein AAFR67_03650, partial [Chloroflexota bacterium]